MKPSLTMQANNTRRSIWQSCGEDVTKWGLHEIRQISKRSIRYREQQLSFIKYFSVTSFGINLSHLTSGPLQPIPWNYIKQCLEHGQQQQQQQHQQQQQIKPHESSLIKDFDLSQQQQEPYERSLIQDFDLSLFDEWFFLGLLHCRVHLIILDFFEHYLLLLTAFNGPFDPLLTWIAYNI